MHKFVPRWDLFSFQRTCLDNSGLCALVEVVSGPLCLLVYSVLHLHFITSIFHIITSIFHIPNDVSSNNVVTGIPCECMSWRCSPPGTSGSQSCRTRHSVWGSGTRSPPRRRSWSRCPASSASGRRSATQQGFMVKHGTKNPHTIQDIFTTKFWDKLLLCWLPWWRACRSSPPSSPSWSCPGGWLAGGYQYIRI